MDLHRLRVVEFDTLVSEKDGKKKNTAELKVYKQEESKAANFDDKKEETNELGSDKKYLGDNAGLPGSSKEPSLIKLKSKSEILRIPSKCQLRKRELKINSSVVDLTKVVQDSTHSNQKKRTLNLFNRKSRDDQKRGEIKKKKDGLKTNDEVYFLFERETPSFIRYSRKRGKNEATKKKHHSKLTNDAFGFQKNKRCVDPYLYQMSCNYLNIDKLCLKKIRNGFRRNKPKRQQSVPECPSHQSVPECPSKHHGVRILDSEVGPYSDERDEPPPIYYNLSTHSQPRKIHRKRSYSHHEKIVREDRSDFRVKDQTVAVSPSSLVSIKKIFCDACVGPSKDENTSSSQRRLPPSTHRKVSPAHQKPLGPRIHKPYPLHSSPRLDTSNNKQNNKNKIGSKISNQRNRQRSRFLQNVTAFQIFKNQPSGKSCIKYVLFGLLIIVWAPCLLAVILAWVVMCPVRTTTIWATDKTKRPFPVMNSFGNIFRKKNPVSEYQRMCFENYPCQKKNFMTSVANWYARAAGTVVNSFKAMISMLKLKNKSPTGAGSSFLKPTHPNPRKRYTLSYVENRGWIIKPRRRHTRSYASTRVVQNMRCELKPTLLPKTIREPCAVKSSHKNVKYKCPVHGIRCCQGISKQNLSPAGDACSMTMKEGPVSFIKQKIRSTLFTQSHRVPCQQVNIPPIFFHPRSGITSNLTKYQTLSPNLKNFNSIQIADMPQNYSAKYSLSQRKNGTRPFGLVIDCPCGSKHPLITNIETFRTHRFALAGKTLKISKKYTPSFKLIRSQGQSTKCGTKGETNKTHKTSLAPHKTGLKDLTKTIQSKSTPISKCKGTRGATKCQNALKRPRCKYKPSVHDRKLLDTEKTQRDKLRTRNKSVSADISQSALTYQVGTNTYKIYLKHKAQSTKHIVSLKGDDLANKTHSKIKHNNEYDIPLTSHYGIKHQSSETNRRKKSTKESLRNKKATTTSRTQYDIALNCPCGDKHRPSKFANKNKTSKTEIVPKESLSYKRATTTSSAQYDIALHCPCGDKHTSSEFASKNKTSKTEIVPKESLSYKRATTTSSAQYDIALHCPCGDKHRSSDFANKNKTKTVPKESLPYKKATTISNRRYDIAPNCRCRVKPDTSDFGGGTENQRSTAYNDTPSSAKNLPIKQENISLKQSDTDDKNSRCTCKNELDISKEIIDPEKIMQYKKGLDCTCGNDKHTSTTALKPPSKQQENVLLKQSDTYDQTSQCTCKDEPDTSKDMIGPEKNMQYKKAIDCTCGNDKHTSTFVLKPPSKQQENILLKQSDTADETFQCTCKNEPDIKSKEIISPGKTMQYKKAIDCTCGNDKYTSTTALKAPSKEQASHCPFNCTCKTKANPSIIDKVPLGAPTLTPKERQSPHSEKHSSKQQSDDKKSFDYSCKCRLSECPCENNQPIGADNKSQYAHKNRLVEQLPSQQPKLSRTHSHTPQTQAKLLGLATNCNSGTQEPLASELKNHLAEYVSSQQIKPAYKKSVEFGLASDCNCGYAPGKKGSNIHETSLSKHSLSQHTHKQPPQLGIAPDCVCQTNDPITTNKKSLNTNETGLADCSLVQKIKYEYKKPPEFGLARDCTCKTLNEKKNLHFHETRLAEHPSKFSAPPIKSLQTPSRISQKKGSALRFASDRRPTTISKTSLGVRPLNHQIKALQIPSPTLQKQSLTFEKATGYPRPTTTEKTSLAEHHLSNRIKLKSSKIPHITTKKKSIVFHQTRQTDLASQQKQSMQTRSQTEPKRSLMRMVSECDDQPSITHKNSETKILKHSTQKSHHTRKTDIKQSQRRLKASQSKTQSFHKYIKCACKHGSSITLCRQRGIDCSCRAKKPLKRETPQSHRPLLIDKTQSKASSSSQQVKYPQKESLSLKKPVSQKRLSCFDTSPEDTCKSKIKQARSKLPRRASVFSRSSKDQSSRMSLIRSDSNCSAEKSKVPAVKTFHLSRGPALADKPRCELLVHTKNQRPETTRGQCLVFPYRCPCSCEDLDKIPHISAKTDKLDTRVPRLSSIRSSVKTEHICSVHHLSSQFPLSKILRNSSKVSRLVLKLRSKLFSRKKSQQTKLLHHAHSQMYSSPSKCPSPVNKTSSSKYTHDKTSLHTRKSILIDKSHLNLSRRSQITEPGFPIYSRNSVIPSACRCPIHKTYSKHSSDKIPNYKRKHSLVDKSYSCLSRRSISWQSKTSQRSSFPSNLSGLDCHCLDNNTSSKTSHHQFHPRLSQRNVSQHSKAQHSSTVMPLIPFECSSDKTSSTENEGISHHYFKPSLGRKSHPRSQHLPNQRAIPTSTTTEKQRISSDPTSHLTRKIALEDRSQHHPSQEPLPSKRSSLFHPPQLKPLTEILRSLTDKISINSRKNGQEKIPPSVIEQTAPIIPGKGACLSEKLHQLSKRISQYSRKSVLEKIPPSGPSPHVHSSQPTRKVVKEQLISDSFSQHLRKPTLGTEPQAGYPYHLSSQQTEIPKESRHYSSQPSETTGKQLLPSNTVCPLPRKSSIKSERPLQIPQHLPSPQQDIPKQPSLYRHSQPKQLTEKLGNPTDIISQQLPKKEQANIAEQNSSERHPKQQHLMPQGYLNPNTFNPLHPKIPIIPGKCTCTAEKKLTLPQNIDLQHLQNRQPVISEHSSPLPEILNYSPYSISQPTQPVAKQRLIPDQKSQHDCKTTLGSEVQEGFPHHISTQHPHLSSQSTSPDYHQHQHSDNVLRKPSITKLETEGQSRFSQHLSSQQPDIPHHMPHLKTQQIPSAEIQRNTICPVSRLRKISVRTEKSPVFMEHIPSHQIKISEPSAAKQHLISDPLSQYPRKTKLGTEARAEQGDHRSSHQPEISNYSPHLSSQPTPLSKKHPLPSDSVPQLLRETIIGTELPIQKPEILQSSPLLRNFQPTRVFLSKCTSTTGKCENPPEISNHSPSQTPEMSRRLLSSQNVHQSHVISGVNTDSAKKIRLSRVNVSNHSNKIGLPEKIGLRSQDVIIQRSEIFQNLQNTQNPQNQHNPQNPQIPPTFPFFKRKAGELPISQPKVSPDKKPPPGLLQRCSSAQVRNGSGGGLLPCRTKPPMPIQGPYPDFDHVLIRYPGHSCARKRSGQIPHPNANYHYPPGVAVTPPSNYSRYPCFVNPANRCGPRSCHDEAALRRAYKRRPLRFRTPKEQKTEHTKEMKYKKIKGGNTKTFQPSGSKLAQCIQCIRHLVSEAESIAWPADISCRHRYIHTLKHRPCFWVYECCPSIYPTFLGCFKFQQNLFQIFKYMISVCFWCPLMVCLSCCCDLICGNG